MIPLRPLLSRLSIFSLIAGLLLVLGANITRAQAQTQVPSLTEDESLSAFEDAVRSAETDAELIDLATALLKAREHTQISYNTFKDGLWIFRTAQSDFYGNFFGDPYAATYDANFIKMDRVRRLVGYQVDPRNGLEGLFACEPLTYDPAFDQSCRGFRYAAADFFFLPIRPDSDSFAPDLATLTSPIPTGTALQTRADDARRTRRRDDTMGRTSEAAGSSESLGLARIPETPDIQIPEDVTARMQERAAELRRAEIERQIRREVEERYGPRHTLTPQQRARLAVQFADRHWSWNDEGDFEEAVTRRMGDRRTPRRTFDRPAREADRPRVNVRSDENGRQRSRAENREASQDDVPARVRSAEEEIERSKSESSDDDESK